MIYLLFLITLLLISCNPDQAKDSGKDKTIECFTPLSHRVEKDVDEMLEEYRYVPLETRDDALIDVPYNVKNIAIFQEDIYIGSGEQLIVWGKYGKFKRVSSKKGNDPQSYLHFNHFMTQPNGDLSIASPVEIVTYSNSHQFINKKRCENVGYIETAAPLNDSLYIIKCMPTPEQLQYRIINHHTGVIINSYDSIINCNRHISSFTNSFKRYEGHIISHGYQSNDTLECTLDSSKIRYKTNVSNRIPPAGSYTQEGEEGMQLIQEEAERGYISHIPGYVESEETILLSLKGRREDLNGIALIDKKDGDAGVLENIKFDDNFRWLPKQFFSLDEGWYTMLMYPENVLEKEEFARHFPGLNEESNPVLFIGKLR